VIDRPLVIKLLCIALVATVMLPIGRMVFPFVADAVTGMQFSSIEAVVSATVGFGLYAAIFG
jgi:hypothetical protein